MPVSTFPGIQTLGKEITERAQIWEEWNNEQAQSLQFLFLNISPDSEHTVHPSSHILAICHLCRAHMGTSGQKVQLLT